MRNAGNKHKHSKFKNTGLIFELLTHQITTDIIGGKETSPAMKILKRYYSTDTHIGKEYVLYKTILSAKQYHIDRGKDLIETVKTLRSRIANNKLKQEKYELIREIKDNYGEDFFKNRVSNYKILASIYQILETDNLESITAPEIVSSKYTILEHIMETPHPKNENIVDNEFKNDTSMALLTYKLLIEKFNKKYDRLNTDQKRILREYISSMSDNSKLRKFVNSEVDSISTTLKDNIAIIEDDVSKIKLEEIITQLHRLKEGNTVKEIQIISLMNLHHLIDELNILTTNESKA